MPGYKVSMGQGLSVRDIKDTYFATGIDQGDAIYSCSAIVLFNSLSRGAGLYHYPSGAINDGCMGSMQAISRMILDINPTECYIIYGTHDIFKMASGHDNIEPSDPYSLQLKNFVLHCLPLDVRLRRMPASSGKVCFNYDRNNGEIKIYNSLPKSYGFFLDAKCCPNSILY